MSRKRTKDIGESTENIPAEGLLKAEGESRKVK